MDNILAENRVLRRLAKVSENYGFNLEEIKIAEKQKIEDYKAQVRYLEKEVEELEGERMQLRNRLRILSNIYDQNPRGDRYLGLTQNELQQVDEFVANLKNKIRVKVTQDDTKTQLIKQIKELEDQVRRCQIEHVEREKDTDKQKRKNKNFNDKDIQLILEQNNELKKALEQITQQLSQLQSNKSITQNKPSIDSENNELDINNKGYPIYLQHLAKPPQPLPGALGNWDDISQVRSYKFKQNIPPEIFELYSEGGFNQTLAKYQIAQLQVMNIEIIKLLTEKEKEYNILQSESEEMKNQLTKCLLIQDNLYEKHYEVKSKLDEKVKIMENQLNDKTCEIQRLNEELYEYKNINQISQNNDRDKLKQKLAEMTQKTSILDVNLIKISRKYSCLKDEYIEISEAYKNYSAEFCKKETILIEKIQGLVEWKKKSQHYLKTLLQEVQDSVHKSRFNILRNKFDKQQDELANIKEKNTQLLSEIHKLKNSERMLFEKNQKIRILEDETLEIQLELQMTKKMLEIIDPHYKKYLISYQKLVDIMINKSISPTQIFQQIDDNRDGFLGPQEFLQAMRNLKVDFNQQEVEILFKFMDFDGSNKIELKNLLGNQEDQALLQENPKNSQFMIYGKKFNKLDLVQVKLLKHSTKMVVEKLLKKKHEETVSYVFHMADTSGDGKITYSEFHSLFENIISDVMRQQLLMTAEDLSWQKKVILKIDEAIHSQGQYIKDLYQLLDNNDDDEIDFIEFKSLFVKLQLNVQDEELRQLFADIDIDSNGSIEYNELINYIRSAKVEKMKIEKMKRVGAKIDAMQKQGQLRELDTQDIQNLPKEARLELKINLLEIKDKNLNSRCDILMYQLNLTEKMNAKLNLQLKDRENEIILQIKKYNELQKLYHRAQNTLEGCETKQMSKQIHKINKRLQKEAMELRVQNKNLKNLHEFASNQVKELLISNERKKFETESLQETIKELQSTSDEKAIVGKLQHSLMIAKYNQSQTNIKYDNLIHDLEKYQQQLQITEFELNEANQDSIESREVLRQKIYDYEDNITDLRNKILPTITMSKIDDMYRRINELSSVKTDLEIQNKKLRDDNHELAIKCDYFEALEQQFDELKNDLKTKYSDQLQQRVIELSLQVSEQKLMEMKAKRDQEIAKEKEEYYQRITRQHLEHVKALEQESELTNKKFNEREQFWRQKHQEAMNLVMNDKEMKEKDKNDDPIYRLRRQAGKTNKIIGTVQLNNTQENAKEKNQKEYQNTVMHKGVKYINELEAEDNENQENIQNLKKEIEVYKERQTSLYQEIDRLKEFVNQLKNEQNNKKYNFINEDSQKIALAAQKTISTLQGLIDDKNYEIERKDLLIEKMKRDFRQEKEKDSAEIRKLLMQACSTSGSRNDIQNNNSFFSKNDEENYKSKNNLESQVDQLSIKCKLQQKTIDELEVLVKRLEDELIISRQNHKVQDLEDQVKALQKLLKENNRIIQDLKKQKEALQI
ncbi:hypothetical protein IMG5_198820 [Ichthyophthirius multifiliis]|uniref:EF-hand domain-containing protein n=1 Tax=Ichthyophthirius multifiliis TaxID=5932 RepID=G0R5G8_ICHMU|nr:hypothetical protein IMG5_198820 [Ichthyophthirius multifiliis]EGR27290.1 hypothetical protein IMG5_198820 [Ichthyophthirius multifiliis]|eukprot:XP_004024174.1 hypothetical protein IMG5_198820 [Ichthyophthirius multifiliis]